MAGKRPGRAHPPGPVVCARAGCGRPWTEHRTNGLPAAGCRGFLHIDPAGASPAVSGTPWPARN